jgi:hypothetical protein
MSSHSPPDVGRRYVDADALIRHLAERVGGDAPDVASAWLKRQRKYPALLGTTGVADAFGLHLPHVTRIRAQGLVPDPIPVVGGRDVYDRDEIIPVAKQYRRDRARALRAREKKNEAATEAPA